MEEKSQVPLIFLLALLALGAVVKHRIDTRLPAPVPSVSPSPTESVE